MPLDGDTPRAPFSEVLPRASVLLERGMARGHHLGFQLCVRKGGIVLVDEAQGEARAGVAMDVGTLVSWFCATKLAASVAVMQQVERGTIGLTDRVGDRVSELSDTPAGSVRLVHLLTHVAGFDGDPVMAWCGAPWTDILGRADQIRLQAEAKPGCQVTYTDHTAFFLLGAVLADATGLPFDILVRQSVFEPIGMVDSWIGMSAPVAATYGDRLGITNMALDGLQPMTFLDDPLLAERVMPGFGGRGPMNELAGLLQELAWRADPDGQREEPDPWLSSRTAREMVRPHREGMRCGQYGRDLTWGLGVIADARAFGAPRAEPGWFGHDGESVDAFACVTTGLVVTLCTNVIDRSSKAWMRRRALLSSLRRDLLPRSGP